MHHLPDILGWCRISADGIDWGWSGSWGRGVFSKEAASSKVFWSWGGGEARSLLFSNSESDDEDGVGGRCVVRWWWVRYRWPEKVLKQPQKPQVMRPKIGFEGVMMQLEGGEKKEGWSHCPKSDVQSMFAWWRGPLNQFEILPYSVPHSHVLSTEGYPIAGTLFKTP